VRIVEPLLWRAKGWCRLEVNVAGYAGEGQQQASVLLPVAPRAEALQVLRLVLPEVDIGAAPLTGVPEQARWCDPLQRRFLAAGADERVFVARRGRWHRETDIVPHEKVQSVRLTQGPLQRRLRLATLHLDTTPGPVQATAAHRDEQEARHLLDTEIERARRARAIARPDRWMRPAVPPPGPTVTP
jgi:putative membrane protein